VLFLCCPSTVFFLFKILNIYHLPFFNVLKGGQAPPYPTAQAPGSAQKVPPWQQQQPGTPTAYHQGPQGQCSMYSSVTIVTKET
jgi:hypothetical protein